MASSNADSPDIDPIAFESQYGYSATEYVTRVARSTLHPDPRRWDDIEGDAPGEAKQGRAGDETRRLAAVAFAESDGGDEAFGAFRSYLGKQANQLIDNGLVDVDQVHAALVKSNES